MNTHIVFGGTGALGAAIIHRLLAEKTPTRAFVRNPTLARKILPKGVELIQGDATDRDSVVKACAGSAVAYHCVNVPYSKWVDLMPTITANILTGVKKAGARLAFPGNVYGYGRFQQIPAKEDHPKTATTKKGQLRNQMEKTLWAAHSAGDVPVVIARMPDYYGPNVINGFTKPIFEPPLHGKKATWPGNLDVPHDMVYIDNVAEAIVFLAKQERAYGEAWHVPGPQPITGREFLKLVFKAAGTDPKMGTLGRGVLRFFGLFNADAREFLELRYEFEEPLVLDGSKYTATFGPFPAISHEEGIHTTMDWFREKGRSP